MGWTPDDEPRRTRKNTKISEDFHKFNSARSDCLAAGARLFSFRALASCRIRGQLQCLGFGPSRQDSADFRPRNPKCAAASRPTRAEERRELGLASRAVLPVLRAHLPVHGRAWPLCG